VIASPSGSLAETHIWRRLPSVPVALGGALTMGARSELVTVRLVLEDPTCEFEAVKVIV